MNFKFKLSRRLARMKLGAVIAGTLLLGCSLSSSPVIARVEGIQIRPGRVSLLPFQAAPLTVVVITSRGIDSSGAAAALVWSTTGGTIINNGILAGVRYITYTSPAQPGNYLFVVTTPTGTPADTASFTVTTTPVPVNKVAVTPATVSLALGDTTRLYATLTDSTGSTVFGRAITWSSSAPTVAMAFDIGFIRATAVGTATITATSEGYSGTAVVTVHQ